jgi:acyl-CoA synthetase (AMP-forming)/AMP-acid ligase II
MMSTTHDRRRIVIVILSMAQVTDPRTAIYRSAHGIQASDVEYPHLSWGDVMRAQATTFAERPWLTYVDAHAEPMLQGAWSYAEFIERTRKLASYLHTLGVGEGDRVAIAGHNHPDTIMAYFACWLMGACAVPLNMTEDDERLAYIIDKSGSRLLLYRTDYSSRVQNIVASTNGPQLINVDTDSTTSTFAEAVNSQAPYPFPHADKDMRWHDCLIVYTSGTTGEPKGVVLIQQNLFADGYDIARWHGIDATQTMMCVLPVHHVNGTIVTHVAPFLNRKFSATQFFASVAAHNVNVVSVVPTLLAFLLEHHGDDARDVVPAHFRHIICGAGPLTCELAARFEASFGVPIVHGYGLSETTCYTCFLPSDLDNDVHRSWMQDHGFPSIGVALPCNEMDIHDDQGRPVAEGKRGEIVARGPNIMKEYDGNPEANAKAFAFGWFRSGDEGFYRTSADGTKYYFITGRLKELIIRGGVNLAPLEIDEVINSAPGVKAGICVGFENDMYGEEVGALVIGSTSNASEEAILEHCRIHLPFHKTPKVVLFTNELPVTSTGKYQRNKVKHLFAEWRATQFKP